MSQETTRAPAVLTGERIQLRSLAERRDGENWVIGRADSGVFISVPEVAHRVISLLSDGRTDHIGTIASSDRPVAGRNLLASPVRDDTVPRTAPAREPSPSDG